MLGLGIGLGVGVPVLVFIIAVIFCNWRTKAQSQRQLSNVRTTVFSITTDREMDLNFYPTQSGLSQTQPLQPVTVECPSQSPSYSSSHSQERSLNDAQLSSGVAPPSYDAALSFPNVPVIIKVKELYISHQSMIN